MRRIYYLRLLFAVLALAISSGTLHAGTPVLQITSSALSLTCNTQTGAVTSGSIVVTTVAAITATTSVTVVPPTVTGLVISPPSGTNAQTITNSNHTVTYTVAPAAACAGLLANSQSKAVQFTVGTTPDVQQNVTVVVTAASPLVVSPLTPTVLCGQVGSPGSYTYTQGSPVSISVTSTLSGGSAFTIGTPSANTVVVAGSGGTASASPIVFTVQAAAACNAGSDGTQVTVAVNAASPAPAVTVTVTIQVVPATTLVATPSPSPLALTCNTATGPGAGGTITITPAVPIPGGGTPIAVTAPTISGYVFTPVSGQTLSSGVLSLVYTVKAAAGCQNLSASPSTNSQSIQFKANGSGSGNTISATIAVTATTSGLTVAPSSVTVVCNRSGSAGSYSYVSGPAQTISVTSGATGGTPFTIGSSVTFGTTTPSSTYLTVTGSGATASSTAATFTVQAKGCASGASGAKYTVPLANLPANPVNLTVTVSVVQIPGLGITPSSATLTYVKGSGTPGRADVVITSPTPLNYSVDTATLPAWLTTDAPGGTANVTGADLRFLSTSICDTLPPGTYTQTIWLKVTGYAETSIPVSLLITNSAGQLSISGGAPQPVTWILNQALPPNAQLTPISSDTPIPYTITTAGIVAIYGSDGVTPITHGIAYSFGSPLSVTFGGTAFSTAVPGQVLTGTVIFTWGVPATQTVATFNVTVVSPGATLSSITPGSLPTASAGQSFGLSLAGTGFVSSSDPTQKTKVGIVSGGTLVFDSAVNITSVTTTTILINITVPSSDPYMDFTNGGTVILGVCNPLGTTCNTPSGTASFSIGSNPIIQVVTSASSFLQPAQGARQTIAPYDMLSLFGSNFCGSACTSSQVLYGNLDPLTMTYPQFLSPDAAGANQRQLMVKFYPAGNDTVGVLIGTATLLFATNSQINLLVPGAVNLAASPVDIIVSFGNSTTTVSSAPVEVNVANTDPGIFTFGQDGQGPGAILGPDWNLVATGHEAALRPGTDSDIVELYLTGLGAPDSVATDTTPGSAGNTYSYNCLSTTYYNTLINPQTVDGSVIQSSLFPSGRIEPCMKDTNPTVLIGGVSAVVKYAGWVADSVAGLYQINVLLPTAAHPFQRANGTTTSNPITGPEVLKVQVNTADGPTQSGVSIAVAPRLKVTGPTGTGLSGTAGTPWTTANSGSDSITIAASDGVGTYSYAVTAGSLPSGLVLNPVATTVQLYGPLAANTAGNYTVTVTATDTSTVPLTGSVTFTLTVAGGLAVTNTTVSTSTTYNTANASVTQVIATGGTWPYYYSIGTGPTGMSIDLNSGVVATTSSVPAGNYTVVINVSDSAGLTGTLSLTIPVKLQMVDLGLDSATGLTGGQATQLATYGGTASGVTYSFATPNTYDTYVHVDPSTGAVTVDSGSTATGANPIAVTVKTVDKNHPANASAGTGSITFNLTIN